MEHTCGRLITQETNYPMAGALQKGKATPPNTVALSLGVVYAELLIKYAFPFNLKDGLERAKFTSPRFECQDANFKDFC
jgi:hypothetical protein